MQKSHDVALVIIFAVLSFVSWATLGQLPVTITGIRGIGYAFLIIHAIPQALAMVFFEGRRWRFFSMHAIFAFLSLPTMMGGAPFDLVGRLPLILVGLISDVVVNSFYKMAKRQKKLNLWIILGTAFRWAIDPFIFLAVIALYVPINTITGYLPIFILLTPLIIVEGGATGYIAYKIYNRVKKTSNF